MMEGISLNYLIIYLLSVFAYLIPILIFVPIKMKFWQKILLYTIIFVNILLLFPMGHICVIAIMISIGIFLYFLDKINVIRNICIFMGGYILGVILDYSEVVMWNLLGFDFYRVRDDLMLYIIYIIFHLILLTVLCIIIKVIYHKLRYKIRINLGKETWRSFSVILFSYLIIFIFNIVMAERIGFTPQVIIANSIFFTGLLVVVIYQFAKAINLYVKNHELELNQKYADEYTSQIEKMYNDHRKVTHDFDKTILLIGDYIENNDMKGLADYYKERIAPISYEMKKHSYKLRDLMNIWISKVKSMVTTKAVQATEKKIGVSIEIKKPISRISMNEVDLATILGIFWDNAIEASVEMKEPKISFIVYQEEDVVAIVLENNHINTGIEYYDIKSSTKGGFHGIGLQNAHTILKKYKNVEHLPKIIDDKFIQRIEITNVENNNGELVDEEDKAKDIDSKDQDS